MCKRFICQIGLVLTLLTFVLVVSSFAISPISLVLSTGPVGAGWYSTAAGIGELVKQKDSNIDIKVVPGAGATNPSRVENGDTELGFGIVSFDKMAYDGIPPYEKPHLNVRSMGAGFSLCHLHVVVNKDSEFNTVEELIKSKKPLKIVTHLAGTTTEIMVRQVFEYYGYTYDDLESWGGKLFLTDATGAVSLFKDGDANVYMCNPAAPASHVMEIATDREIKILEVPQDLIEYFEKEYKYVGGNKAIIPKNAYTWLEKDIAAPGIFSEFLVNKDVSEEAVYAITKILGENKDELVNIHTSLKDWDPKYAWNWVGVPLHPGAEKYYREAGYME